MCSFSWFFPDLRLWLIIKQIKRTSFFPIFTRPIKIHAQDVIIEDLTQIYLLNTMPLSAIEQSLFEDFLLYNYISVFIGPVYHRITSHSTIKSTCVLLLWKLADFDWFSGHELKDIGLMSQGGIDSSFCTQCFHLHSVWVSKTGML